MKRMHCNFPLCCRHVDTRKPYWTLNDLVFCSNNCMVNWGKSNDREFDWALAEQEYMRKHGVEARR